MDGRVVAQTPSGALERAKEGLKAERWLMVGVGDFGLGFGFGSEEGRPPIGWLPVVV